MVKAIVVGELLLHLLHYRQNPGLAVIRAIRWNVGKSRVREMSEASSKEEVRTEQSNQTRTARETKIKFRPLLTACFRPGSGLGAGQAGQTWFLSLEFLNT